MPDRPCQMLSAGRCATSGTESAPQVWWSGPLPSELHLDHEPYKGTGRQGLNVHSVDVCWSHVVSFYLFSVDLNMVTGYQPSTR